MGARERWVVVAVATLATLAFALPAASAGRTRHDAQAAIACHSRLNNGNHGHASPSPASPCWVGNVGVECNYEGCETFCGNNVCSLSKVLVCRLSAELGRRVPVPGPGSLVGYRIEDPHKTISCHGSTTILAVYLEHQHLKTGVHTFRAVPHGHHSVATTLHYVENVPAGELFILMAQRG